MNNEQIMRQIYGGDPRHIPRYGFVQASNYLKIPVNTLKNWVCGYTYSVKESKKKRFSKPLIFRPDSASNLLSFINLTEAHILVAIRQSEKIPMYKVRTALDYLSGEFKSQHPLLEHDFQTNGVDLFIEHLGDVINASRSGQLAMKEIIKSFLHRIKRDRQNMPALLYPFTKQLSYVRNSNQNLDDQPKPVSINPLVSFGRPVLSGSGIPTDILFDRFYAGDSIIELAKDYDLKEGEVEEAIRYETPALRAA